MPTAVSSRSTMQALLADIASGARASPSVPSAGVGELIAWFRQECERLVAPCDPEVLPLRLPKGRISDLLACERGAVAALGVVELTEALVRGRITDVLVAQHVTLGLTADVEADARGGLAAGAVTDAIAWLEGASPEARARVWAHAGVVRQGLIEGWGTIDRSWWPRVQERLSVLVGDDGDGSRRRSRTRPRLVLSAQFDLVLGGPPTERPWVVIEAKSGSAADRHRSDLYWYALVATLRYCRPPALCATWTADDGGLVPVPVSLGALESAAQRGLDALARLVELVGGRSSAVSPYAGCGWCPVLDRCEPGLAHTAATGGTPGARGVDGGDGW